MRVCLFFTYEMSLKKWDELGILEREVFLYKNLACQGIEVAFFTYGNEEDLAYAKQLPQIKIIPAYLGIRKAKGRKTAFLQSLWLPFKFRKALSYYDIFKTNQIWGAWVPLLAKWLTGKRLLVRCGYEHYYTLLAERLTSAIEKIIFYLFSAITYYSSDHIIVTTKKIADFICRCFFISKEKISIIPNLINTELFNIKNDVLPLEKRLIYIGRLSAQKNLFNLIRACKEADVSLDLVGAGELRPELEKEITRLNMDVRFLGICPNFCLPDLLAKYRIFVLVSFYEGSPKALLEAMSCGKAVIGTNVDGIREVIKDGENGILCGISGNEIAEAILKLKNNIELRKKLGKNARAYILDKHSINKIITDEFNIYSALLLRNKKFRLNEKNNQESFSLSNYS